MKKITRTFLFLTSLALLPALSLNAQNPTLKEVIASKIKSGNEITSGQLVKNTQAQGNAVTQMGQKTTLVNCTDKIDYVGSTQGPYYTGIGGPTVTANVHEVGVFQVYPGYTGEVLGIEFYAAKYNVVANPKILFGIFDLLGNDPDVSAQYPSIVPSMTLTSTTNSVCTYTFASPIQVTNGFAIGIYVLGQDSARIAAGPLLGGTTPYYSYVYNSQSNLYTFNQYYNINANVLAKPIIKTSVNPTWLTAKTSTGCGLPSVYGFTNTTGANPSYVGNSVINPSGVTRVLDFGDNSTVMNNFGTGPVTHSYTAIGNYTANYTQTYVGWTNNCAESKTLSIAVDNPIPSFVYNANGLTVMFTNTSQNLNSFTWNFGDLTTSTQVDPTHTFSSPGTYVIELEATAPCGTVKYTQSIVVAVGTGISKNTSAPSTISLYPNPATNVLNINYSGSDKPESKIQIYNTLGAVLKNVNAGLESGKTTIDISDLPKGMYFVKIKTSLGEEVKTFVKE